MAEYSVGFVMFNFASRERVDVVVPKIRREPTSGKKPLRSPPEIARSLIHQHRDALLLSYMKVEN